MVILFFGSMTIWAFWPTAASKKAKMHRERLQILQKQGEIEAEQRLTEQVNILDLI
jgi:hypothetical protein